MFSVQNILVYKCETAVWEVIYRLLFLSGRLRHTEEDGVVKTEHEKRTCFLIFYHSGKIEVI